MKCIICDIDLKKQLKFCSYTCYNASRQSKIEKKCVHCGKLFYVFFGKRERIFCSRECCYAQYSGENCYWRYKGGTISSHGYRKVWLTKEKRAEYEHRLLMEKSLGRKLRKQESVHHIDGDTLNNELSNLHLFSINEHRCYHANQLSRSAKGIFKASSLKGEKYGK